MVAEQVIHCKYHVSRKLRDEYDKLEGALRKLGVDSDLAANANPTHDVQPNVGVGGGGGDFDDDDENFFDDNEEFSDFEDDGPEVWKQSCRPLNLIMKVGRNVCQD